jgi:lipoate-protein ligase A
MGDGMPDLQTIQEALVMSFCQDFGLQAAAADLRPEEQRLAQRRFQEEIGTDEFVAEIDEPEMARGTLSGAVVCPGGTVECHLRLEGPAQDRIREVLFTGDFFVTPPRIILDLESGLRRVAVSDVGPAIDDFFAQAGAEVLSVTPADFTRALQNALQN